MDADVNRIMNGYIDAKDAANYAEALVLNDELISGDNYRMKWTTSYNGEYPPAQIKEE